MNDFELRAIEQQTEKCSPEIRDILLRLIREVRRQKKVVQQERDKFRTVELLLLDSLRGLNRITCNLDKHLNNEN